jgi:hypothetical protein
MRGLGSGGGFATCRVDRVSSPAAVGAGPSLLARRLPRERIVSSKANGPVGDRAVRRVERVRSTVYAGASNQRADIR